jgi:activator of Hsp90 ATPase-like protein
VRRLDLRPGGELLYAMTATAAPQIEFMKQAGMPLTTEARVTYAEVSPMQRLAYVHSVDFIPGVEAYDVATVVEFHAERNKVRMVIDLDAMHSDEWTQRAVGGWESQLSKVDKVFKRAAGE